MEPVSPVKWVLCNADILLSGNVADWHLFRHVITNLDDLNNALCLVFRLSFVTTDDVTTQYYVQKSFTRFICIICCLNENGKML
jgi:hypothetical protein